MTEITVSYPIDQKHFYFVKSQDHKFLKLSILQDTGTDKKLESYHRVKDL